MRDMTIYLLMCMTAFAMLFISMFLTVSLSANPYAQVAFATLGLLIAALWLRRIVRQWKQARRLRQAQVSKLAETLTPQLQGEFSPYVIEAAERLGEARDTTAVPALIVALEHCVETQRPGWRDRAAALADALGRIGDRRALSLLYRLDNVRGIGLIPAVRNAIAAIEPQTSLLRAGSADNVPPQSLLRSVQHRPQAEDATVLLRSVETVDS